MSKKLIYLILGGVFTVGLTFLFIMYGLTAIVRAFPREFNTAIFAIFYCLIGVSFYANILLLIDRHKILNTEEQKQKRLAKLQSEINKLNKD